MSPNSEKTYDLIADKFSLSRAKASVNDAVINFSNRLKRNDSVLDVGCGSGLPVTKYLTEKGFQVTGIDISSKLLSKARVNVPNGCFIKTDITKFTTDQLFDGIVAWDSLFHLKPSQHEVVFKKLYNLLNTDGYLLFTHGGSEASISGDMFGQLFTYSSPGPEKIKDMLKKIGFSNILWNLNRENVNGYLIVLNKK